jgi:hypothetical protein
MSLWRLAFVTVLAAGCSEYNMTSSQSTDGPPGPQEDTEVDGDGDPVPTEGAGGIRGRICSPSEHAYVVGAEVYVETDDGLISTVTDGDGWFLLENVPAGDHTVMVEKGSFHTTFDVTVEADEVTELAEEECLSAEEVSVAVVTGQYDSIQVVLDRLGVEYTLVNGVSGNAHVNLLRTPAELEKYDIVFFNCGMNDNWLTYKSEIAANLRDYVSNGGSVYVSDWSYFLAEVAYPDMIEFIGEDSMSGSAYVGEMGSVQGIVKDPTMIAALGSDTAQLNYDLPSWAAPEKPGTGKVLIRGTFTYIDGWSYRETDGPLAARQEDGDGTIVYTSFHNERQMTFDMDVLLEEIILSL